MYYQLTVMCDLKRGTSEASVNHAAHRANGRIDCSEFCMEVGTVVVESDELSLMCNSSERLQ